MFKRKATASEKQAVAAQEEVEIAMVNIRGGFNSMSEEHQMNRARMVLQATGFETYDRLMMGSIPSRRKDFVYIIAVYKKDAAERIMQRVSTPGEEDVDMKVKETLSMEGINRQGAHCGGSLRHGGKEGMGGCGFRHGRSGPSRVHSHDPRPLCGKHQEAEVQAPGSEPLGLDPPIEWRDRDRSKNLRPASDHNDAARGIDECAWIDGGVVHGQRHAAIGSLHRAASCVQRRRRQSQDAGPSPSEGGTQRATGY
jgi:hypothetical protein|eukprot:7389440-Prymnesium_polylepis.1